MVEVGAVLIDSGAIWDVTCWVEAEDPAHAAKNIVTKKIRRLNMGFIAKD